MTRRWQSRQQALTCEWSTWVFDGTRSGPLLAAAARARSRSAMTWRREWYASPYNVHPAMRAVVHQRNGCDWCRLAPCAHGDTLTLCVCQAVAVKVVRRADLDVAPGDSAAPGGVGPVSWRLQALHHEVAMLEAVSGYWMRNVVGFAQCRLVVRGMPRRGQLWCDRP